MTDPKKLARQQIQKHQNCGWDKARQLKEIQDVEKDLAKHDHELGPVNKAVKEILKEEVKDREVIL